MKIAYMSSSIIPSRFANSVHVMKMCQAFAKNGHSVILYAYKGKDNVEDLYQNYGVDPCFEIERILRIPVPKVGSFLYGKLVKRKVSKSSLPDIFYGRDPHSLFEITSMEIPFIYEAHTPPNSQARFRLENHLLRHSNLRRLVTISNALKLEYLRLFPQLSESKILVAHDAADIPSPDEAKSDTNTEVVPDNGRICVGYVGSLYRGKGVEIVVALADELPDFEFHVVGGTQEEIKQWKSYTNASNIFFHGFVNHGSISKYYKKFDILVIPCQERVTVLDKGDISKWTSPLKLFEYMSYAKPIVSSDLPVLREVLHDGINCLLCPADDVESWRNALLRLSESKELREQLGNTAYKDFLANYTWKSRAEKVIS